MIWKITILLNTILMGAFSFGSAISQIRLRNGYCTYPHANEGTYLPVISAFALKNEWIYVAVPIVWAVITFTLLALNWKTRERKHDIALLHTSATMLIGFSMLGFFVVAGIIPFIPMIVHLRPN